MRVFVLTCDARLWALQIFAHQFNKYWSGNQSVLVGGFSPPDFQLPPNFKFHSIGAMTDYPANKWSNAAIKFIRSQPDERFILMLEDYWLVRQVNTAVVNALENFATLNPQAMRVDLTTDRLYAKGTVDAGHFGSLDIIEGSPAAEYHVSLQAAIWRKSAILEILELGESPWEFEIAGSGRAAKIERLKVYGTRQNPIKYVIGVRAGHPSFDGAWQYPPKQMSPDDVGELRTLGIVPGFL